MFIKLTVIEHIGSEITKRTPFFINGAHIVFFQQEAEARGHQPAHSSVFLTERREFRVVEGAGWIAQELGCKGRD